jgi:hypothetical protein
MSARIAGATFVPHQKFQAFSRIHFTKTSSFVLRGLYILPVSVDVKSDVHVMEGDASWSERLHGTIDMLRNRPEAKVTIGTPRKIAEEADIQKLRALFAKRKEAGRLTKEEIETFKQLRDSLNKASDEIMQDIADMLPEEKRGAWGKDFQG